MYGNYDTREAENAITNHQHPWIRREKDRKLWKCWKI